MRNKYPGCCIHCREKVDVGEGYFERRAGRFVVRCIKCVAWGKAVKGKPLSDAQKETLEEGRIARAALVKQSTTEEGSA